MIIIFLLNILRMNFYRIYRKKLRIQIWILNHGFIIKHEPDLWTWRTFMASTYGAYHVDYLAW